MRISVYTAEVPMKRDFVHAAKARSTSQSVLVRCEIAGATGWGEGAPRPYVTGETLDSAARALAAFDFAAVPDIEGCSDFASGVAVLSGIDFAALVGPAAGAALEIALFDAWCRAHDRDIVDAMRLIAGDCLLPRASVRASSLVLDASREPGEYLSSMSGRALEVLRHVKLKGMASVSRTVDDVLAVRRIVGPDVTVSVDANGIWAPDQACEAAARLAGLVDWIEEPTGKRDWATMARMSCPVMLDESAVSTTDIEAAAAHGAAHSVNVRVSKCGGITGSLRMIERARQLGLRCQLGVQVAEIGPLWAVGRKFAAWADGLLTVESGRQDEWFDRDLTVPAYEVDRETHCAEPLPGPGTGLAPSPKTIDSLLRRVHTRSERGCVAS